MTKRKDKQTQPESLSKQGKEWLAEVDWDLHEQLGMEEEGQPVPMQDFPSQSPEASSEPPARGSLTSGAFYQQIKNLTEDFTKSLEEENTMKKVNISRKQTMESMRFVMEI